MRIENKTIPPYRQPRLAALKAQLDAGTYTVDLDRLASRIVDDELARLTSR